MPETKTLASWVVNHQLRDVPDDVRRVKRAEPFSTSSAAPWAVAGTRRSMRPCALWTRTSALLPPASWGEWNAPTRYTPRCSTASARTYTISTTRPPRITSTRLLRSPRRCSPTRVRIPSTEAISCTPSSLVLRPSRASETRSTLRTMMPVGTSPALRECSERRWPSANCSASLSNR